MDMENIIGFGGLAIIIIGAIIKQVTDQARGEEKQKAQGDALKECMDAVKKISSMETSMETHKAHIETLFDRGRESERKTQELALILSELTGQNRQILQGITELKQEWATHKQGHPQFVPTGGN